MQALEQPRIRRTPFGDTPTPTQSRTARANFAARHDAEAARYEIFVLAPALDGLGNAKPPTQRARN